MPTESARTTLLHPSAFRSPIVMRRVLLITGRRKIRVRNVKKGKTTARQHRNISIPRARPYTRSVV